MIKKKGNTSSTPDKTSTTQNVNLHGREDKPLWMNKLGDYLLDVSKYVLTGVVISSLFEYLEERTIIYILGIVIAIFSLFAGLFLTNKKKGT